MPRVRVAAKLFRLGLQELLYDSQEKQHYIVSHNKNGRHIFPIPEAKVARWKELLR